MYSIGLEAKAFWVDLNCGARLLCAPVSSPVYEACRSRAIRLVDQARHDQHAVDELGGHIDSLPDLETEDGREGATQAVFAWSLAALVVTDWEGVGLDDKKTKAPASAENIKAFFKMPDVPGDFLGRYLASYRRMMQEGNV